MDENLFTKQFNELLDTLFRRLEVVFHKPGDIVIEQRENIWESYDKLKENLDDYVYFVIDGTYRI